MKTLFEEFEGGDFDGGGYYGPFSSRREPGCAGCLKSVIKFVLLLLVLIGFAVMLHLYKCW